MLMPVLQLDYETLQAMQPGTCREQGGTLSSRYPSMPAPAVYCPSTTSSSRTARHARSTFTFSSLPPAAQPQHVVRHWAKHAPLDGAWPHVEMLSLMPRLCKHASRQLVLGGNASGLRARVCSILGLGRHGLVIEVLNVADTGLTTGWAHRMSSLLSVTGFSMAVSAMTCGRSTMFLRKAVRIMLGT